MGRLTTINLNDLFLFQGETWQRARKVVYMYNTQRKVLLSLMLVGRWILVYLYLSHVVSLHSGPSIQYDRGTEGQGFTLQPSINRANGSSRTTKMILEQPARSIARVNIRIIIRNLIRIDLSVLKYKSTLPKQILTER